MGSFAVLPGAGAQIGAALQQIGLGLGALAEPQAQLNMAFDQMLLTNPQMADVLAATFRPGEGEEFSQTIADMVGEERARALAERPPALDEAIRTEAVKIWEGFTDEDKAKFIKENQFGMSPLDTLQTTVGLQAFQLISDLGSGVKKQADLTDGEALLLKSVWPSLFDIQGGGQASQASLMANARPVFLRLADSGFTGPGFSMQDVMQWTINPGSKPEISAALESIHQTEVELLEEKQGRQARQDRSTILGRIATLQNRVTIIQDQRRDRDIDAKAARTALENITLALNQQFQQLADAGGATLRAEFVPRVGFFKGAFTPEKRGQAGIRIVDVNTGEAVDINEVLIDRQPDTPGAPIPPEAPPTGINPPEDMSVFNPEERADIAALQAVDPEKLPAVLDLLRDRNRPFYDKLVENGVIAR